MTQEAISSLCHHHMWPLNAFAADHTGDYAGGLAILAPQYEGVRRHFHNEVLVPGRVQRLAWHVHAEQSGERGAHDDYPSVIVYNVHRHDIPAASLRTVVARITADLAWAAACPESRTVLVGGDLNLHPLGPKALRPKSNQELVELERNHKHDVDRRDRWEGCRRR